MSFFLIKNKPALSEPVVYFSHTRPIEIYLSQLEPEKDLLLSFGDIV